MARNAIVSLIIRGKDEAGKIIQAVRGSYRQLVAEQIKVAESSAKVTLTAKQQDAIWVKARGSVGDFNRLLREHVAQQRRAAAEAKLSATTWAGALMRVRAAMMAVRIQGPAMFTGMMVPLQRFGSFAQSTFGRVRSAVFGLRGAMAMLGASITGAVITGFLVSVNREYGKLLTQLETFERSSAGARAVFKDLAMFAARTPFQIGELVEAYIVLRTAGITPTMETMQLFGDHAAAFGGKINDFAEAIRSASTGMVVPLKQFGITLNQQGEKFIATYNGVSTTIGRSTADLVKYLETLSKANFAGGMERQSKTLDGALANVQDALESLARAIGDAGLTDWLIDMAKGMKSFTDSLTENDGALRKWVEYVRDTFGILGASFAELKAEMKLLVAEAAEIKVFAFGTGVDVKGKSHKQIEQESAAIKNAVQQRVRDAQAEFAQAQQRRVRLIQERTLRASMNSAGLTPLALQQIVAAGAGTGGVGVMFGGGLPGGLTPGGLRRTGGATAPSTIMSPGDPEKKADDARRKALHDLQEQADILGEQIDLRVAGVDALERAVRLEQRLAGAIGDSTTTEAERWSLVKTTNALRATRRGAGLMTADEAFHQRITGGMLGAGGVTPESVQATADRIAFDAKKIKAPVVKRDMAGNITVGETRGIAQAIGEGLQDAVKEGERLDQIISDMASDTFRGFGSAVEGAFAALADGSVEAGHAFSAAMLGALGEVASGFGRFFLAQATAEFGKGIAGDARGFAAAGYYSAAAMSMFAIGGALKGQASVTARRGARGGGGASAAMDDSRSLTGTKGEGVIVIEGDPVLDMSNPRTERSMKRAMESLAGRKVRIKRRR